MNNFFDLNSNKNVITIYPGEFYVSCDDELVTTILGSCVSIVLYDSDKAIGGINHYMLAKKPTKVSFVAMPETRFGDKALDLLIFEMQKKGASVKNLKAKIFGGSNVLSFSKKSEALIGKENIEFARNELKKRGIPIVKEDVGGVFSRKIVFEPRTFKVLLKRTLVSSKN